MKQRQGLCPRCNIAWTWSLNIKLTEQICAHCGGKLSRVSRRVMTDSNSTWMTWEGYTRPVSNQKEKSK